MYISVFTCHMTTKVMTRQGDGLWYWATMHKSAELFDHVIICSFMTNKECSNSNSASPMDTKIDRVMAYDMGPMLKTSHLS